MKMTEKLDLLMAQRGIENRAELAQQADIPYTTIANFYVKGTENTKRSTLIKLAKYFDVSLDYLADDDIDTSTPRHPSLRPVVRRSIPILGRIACGEPIWAEQGFEGYVDAGADIHADFCVIAAGDSMIHARIRDGDIVFIRETPTVENGEIAAVLIGDEVTLKRFYRSDEAVTLVAENPAYSPMLFAGEQLRTMRILGRAIAFQSRL